MAPEKLIDLAKEAMEKAYAPYSGYKVGAALLCADGTVYQGCNIENASYSETICAERVSLFEAVKNGEREFESICIVGSKNGKILDFCYPCGACRQVLSEFCYGSLKVLLFNGNEFKTIALDDLLPNSFGGEYL